MRLATVARYAICAGLLAGALPAPAAAQFGGLKRKLKEKIINAAVDGAANKALGPDTSATGTPAPGTTTSGSRARARTSAPAAGPTFNEYLLEVTPEVLDQLQRGLAVEQAERKALAAHKRKVLPREEYNRCRQKIIMDTPEGRAAFSEFRATLQAGGQDAMQKAGDTMNKRIDELARPRCGLDEIEARDLEQQDQEKIHKAGLAASGLTEYQFATLKERILPFCKAAKAADDAVSSGRVSAGAAGIYYVYTKREMEGLRPLCGKLTPLLEVSS